MSHGSSTASKDDRAGQRGRRLQARPCPSCSTKHPLHWRTCLSYGARLQATLKEVDSAPSPELTEEAPQTPARTTPAVPFLALSIPWRPQSALCVRSRRLIPCSRVLEASGGPQKCNTTAAPAGRGQSGASRIFPAATSPPTAPGARVATPHHQIGVCPPTTVALLASQGSLHRPHVNGMACAVQCSLLSALVLSGAAVRYSQFQWRGG